MGPKVLFLAVGLSMASVSGSAQSNYPERTIRFIVGAGTPNTVARIIGQKLTESLGKPVVVENVPGAGGSVAADRVAKSSPDGYTIYISGDAALTTNATLYDKLSYDPVKDFAPITLIVDSVNILGVHPSVPAHSVQELVALAREQPGKLTFGSGGNGTSQHLGGELFKTLAGIDIVHVPYRDSNQVLPDLVSGRLTMQFGNISNLLQLTRDGTVRGLAVTSLKRAPMAPHLPTMSESGFPGFEATAWVGMAAPAGTPEPIIRKLQEETVRIISEPQMREKLTDLGFIVVGSDPDQFAAQIKAEIVKKGKIVKESGAKLN